MYLVNTRPDINFAINSLSQFMVDPWRVHWIVAKYVLRYLRGTVEYVLLYEGSGGERLASFTMLTGQDVQRTGRVLWDVVSSLDRASFPGSAGSRVQWH
jgi:hypothetical protein